MTGDKPGGDGGEGFLSRWSRRKQQVARGAVPERPEPAAASSAAAERAPVARDAAASAEPPATAPAAAEPEIDLSKLPKLDELTADTDYTQFLARGVPEELRTSALRKAWTLDPKIRDFIEVAENQWDFNDPNGVPGFGELAPGTSLDALLAQATGHTPAPEPPPQVALAEAPPSTEPAAGPHAAPQRGAEDSPRSDEPALAEPAPADPQIMQAQTAPVNSGIPQDRPDALVEHIPRPLRRRHGGALPG